MGPHIRTGLAVTNGTRKVQKDYFLGLRILGQINGQGGPPRTIPHPPSKPLISLKKRPGVQCARTQCTMHAQGVGLGRHGSAHPVR